MPAGTTEQILDTAQQLAQERGFHAFSFREIAKVVGIKSASIHYHYPTKDHLGAALVERYRQRFARELAGISEAYPGAIARLEAFGAIFRRALDAKRFCLCGMLGAEVGGIPALTKGEVARFFRDTETWLGGVLAAGRSSGELDFDADPIEEAFGLLALLEGSLLAARNLDDPKRFDAALGHRLRRLGSRG